MKKCESKLNPLAAEFVPSTRRRLSATAPEFFPSGHIRRPIVSNVAQAQRSRAQPGSSHAESESSSRIRKDKSAEKESKIKRTVYVRDIDPRITEEELIWQFSNCGVVKGSCICGATQSGLRYGFVEFENEDCAKASMRLNCTRIGLYPIRVLPSHRTIAPRNLLPCHSGDDQEKIVRTVCCSYIDKTLSEKDLKEFFEIQCGEVSCIRLLGDYKISNSRHGFIEFVKEEFAVAAIKCTGMVLGNYRVKYLSEMEMAVGKEAFEYVKAHYWTQIRDLQTISSLSDSNSFITDKQSLLVALLLNQMFCRSIHDYLLAFNNNGEDEE